VDRIVKVFEQVIESPVRRVSIPYIVIKSGEFAEEPEDATVENDAFAGARYGIAMEIDLADESAAFDVQ
jgi:hypothetical protein